MNFPSYFCLNFGLPLEDRPEADIRADLERLARHDAVALNESLFYVRPGLADELRALNPKIDVYLVLNASGVWLKPSQYFPTMSELHAEADDGNWWLRYHRPDDQVIVSGAGWPDFALINYGLAEARGWWRYNLRRVISKYGVGGIFWDESYRNLLHMARVREIEYSDDVWRDGQTSLIRHSSQFSRLRPMLNGTMAATPAQPTRFWQNCETLRASELIARTLRDCEEQPVSTRRIVWQFNSTFWPPENIESRVALASLYDASIQTSDHAFRSPGLIVPGGCLPGSWGDGARDSNGMPLVTVDGEWHTREFQKRTVSVNIVTGEVRL